MPELPDVNLYVARLSERLVGQKLVQIKVYSPFVLRSFATPPQDLSMRRVESVFRQGKRIVLAFENDYFLIVHLMVAGRFLWLDQGSDLLPKPSKITLVSMSFDSGVLTLQEASQKKRAGIWVVRGKEELTAHQRTGVNVEDISTEEFGERLLRENRTLKRVLTDPNTFDGIGNAYSDEILFHARLSPVKLSRTLTAEECARLHEASKSVLSTWADKLLQEYKQFPKPSQITAFRKEFCVHGRFNQACLECGAPIQRIVGTDNEMNYCARCQNGGKILADRSLSRLLKDEWPKTIDQLVGDP